MDFFFFMFSELSGSCWYLLWSVCRGQSPWRYELRSLYSWCQALCFTAVVPLWWQEVLPLSLFKAIADVFLFPIAVPLPAESYSMDNQSLIPRMPVSFSIADPSPDVKMDDFPSAMWIQTSWVEILFQDPQVPGHIFPHGSPIFFHFFLVLTDQ